MVVYALTLDISADLPGFRRLSLSPRSRVHRNQQGIQRYHGLSQGQKNDHTVNETRIDRVQMHRAATANMLVRSHYVTFPLTARLVTLSCRFLYWRRILCSAFQVANSSQVLRADAYENRDRYADMARLSDPRDRGRAADGHRDVQRGDPQDLRRRSPPREIPGRHDLALKTTGPNDRRRDADPRGPFSARVDGHSLPDRRSPPPHVSRLRAF
jgi:hypothetical protein